MNNLRSMPTVAGIAAVAGAVLNLAIYAGARAADVDFLVYDGSSSPPEEVSAALVAVMSLLGFVVGLVAYALASWLGRPGTRTLQVVAIVIAVGSSIPLLTGSDTSAGTKLSLTAMHLVVGAAYVVALDVVRRNESVPEGAVGTPATA